MLLHQRHWLQDNPGRSDLCNHIGSISCLNCKIVFLIRESLGGHMSHEFCTLQLHWKVFDIFCKLSINNFHKIWTTSNLLMTRKVTFKNYLMNKEQNLSIACVCNADYILLSKNYSIICYKEGKGAAKRSDTKFKWCNLVIALFSKTLC